MAIKYYHNPVKRQTFAVLEDTRYDAALKISKVLEGTKSLCFDWNKYIMPSSFRAVAKCHPADEWDPEIGEKVAKEKLMKKYYKAYDKCLEAFVKDLNEAMFEVTQRF